MQKHGLQMQNTEKGKRKMKTLDEMMQEMNSGLETKLKMGYRVEKFMKKMWGKHRAYQIALRRKWLSILEKNSKVE